MWFGIWAHLLNQLLHLLAPRLIKQRVPNLHIIQHLLERKRHSTTNNQTVHLIQHILNQLNLIANLRTSQDRQERPLRALQRRGEVLQLLLDQESRSLLRQIHAHHRRVCAVCGAEGVVDVHIPQRCEALAEFLHVALVCFDFVAVLVLGAAFLFRVEAQVLQQHDAAAGGAVDRLLHFRADAVVGEGHFLSAEQLLELRDDGLKAVFGVHVAVWAAEVGHEHDGFGAMVDGVLDGGEGADDALVVGDFAVGLLVERDVEVDLYTEFMS